MKHHPERVEGGPYHHLEETIHLDMWAYTTFFLTGRTQTAFLILQTLFRFAETATVATATSSTAAASATTAAATAAVCNAATFDGIWARIALILPPEVFQKTLMAGLCRTADVLCSFSLLSRLSPVTHSVRKGREGREGRGACEGRGGVL